MRSSARPTRAFTTRTVAATTSDPDWILQPRHQPIRRQAAYLAYDKKRNEVVLFGGQVEYGNLLYMSNETWTWDGHDWRERHPANSPSPRYFGRMVYDEKIDKVVLFGGIACDNNLGCSSNESNAETWLWDGSDWSNITPTTGPPSRYEFAMTYNPDTQQVLVYGGCLAENCDTPGADLWAFDGTSWSLVNAAATPGPRYMTQLAYDRAHQQLVLFSGFPGIANNVTPGRVLNDTWTFDGATWTQQTPANSPIERYGGGLVWDSARQRLVLYGGLSWKQSARTDVYRQDTWIWDGSNWTQQQTASAPRRSAEIGFVYNDSLGKEVYFGGNRLIVCDHGTCPWGSDLSWYDDQTWVLDASGWARPAAAEPEERSHALITYDSATNQVIMVGTECEYAESAPNCNDMWNWNGERWTQLHPPSGLVAAYAWLDVYGMAYDSLAQQVVAVVSSHASTATVADVITYTWDGAEWTAHPNTADPGMVALQFPVVTHDVTGRPILFGGTTYDAQFNATDHNDTFRWDGVQWSKIDSATKPPGRELMQAAFDSSGQALLFGGATNPSSGITYLADTWTWDASTWTQHTPPSAPSARGFGVMAYDPQGAQAILFGGTGPDPSSLTGGISIFTDTWSWNGSNWTQLLTATLPPPVIQASMTRNPNGGVVMFGGQAYNPGQDISDTWTYGVDLARIALVSITRLTSGHALLQAKAAANRSFDVAASPDLSVNGWNVIATVNSDAQGRVAFEDVNAASFQRRFYRLQYH